MKEMAEADVLWLQPTEEGGGAWRRMVVDWWVFRVLNQFIYGKKMNWNEL